jgi:hypothetical protein
VSRESRRREDESYREWKGAYRPYDILREATIALGVVLALAVVLTVRQLALNRGASKYRYRDLQVAADVPSSDHAAMEP